MAAKQYERIVIGLDQSYANTGLSLACDGELRRISSIRLSNYSSNSERRSRLTLALDKALLKATNSSANVDVYIERIRLQSQGFLNINYIKSIGALNARIVDSAKCFNVSVYSVDTRCWKSNIVGTSKPQKNKYNIAPEKWPTIKYICKLGFKEQILVPVSAQKKKGVFEYNGKRYTFNDDAADSARIALYGFLPIEEQKRELEH